MFRSLHIVCVLGALLLLASCGSSRDTAATDPASNPARAGEQSGAQPDSPSEASGDSLAAVETLLKARHTDDLPDGARWRSIEGAEAALMHHARHGDPIAVRVRALNALAFFPGEAVRELLVEVARREGPPESLRAAALRGLSGHLEGAHPEVVEVLRAGVMDDDPRVHGAAVASLASSTATLPELERLVDDEKLTEAARTLVRDALQAR